MKRYTTYKDSGVQWLGEIPSHWEKWKVKHLFHIGRGRVIAQTELTEAGYPVYSSQTLNNGCLGLIPTYDYDCTQLTWTTDGVNAGTVFLREGKHNCTNVCGTLLPKKNDNDIHFLKYALGLTAFFHKRKDTNGYKIMNNEMAEITLFLPPLPEQQAIAAYLDTQTANLDTAIAQQQQLISLLQERKQIIINHAVTRGLDNNVALKNSGVDWIGEMPEHWKVCKTLFCLSMPITDGPHTTPQIFDEGIPFVSAEAVSAGNGKIDFSHVRGYISESFYNECCKKYIPAVDDIYMIKSGATTGRIAIVDTERKFTIWSPLAVFRVNKEILLSKYLFYYLKSSKYQKQIELNWSYGTQQNIGMRTLEKIKVVYPPKAEQHSIVEYLDERCFKIDIAIESIKQQIALLQERKQIIINEVVTGKVKIM